MKITDIKLYTIKSGDTGARGAVHGGSQSWGGGWQAQTLVSNLMSVHPKYSPVGKGTDIQPIFSVLEDEPLPVNGKVSIHPTKTGFGVELKRELLVPFQS